MPPTNCLPVTGGVFNFPALLLGVLLLVGGIGLGIFIRRRGHKVAGAAVLAVVLFGALIGIGAAPQAANAACGSVAPPPAAEPASIGSFVWADANGNGIQDAGEFGVAGIRLTLLDATTNLPVTTGFGGAAINPVQTTDASGHYAFTDLAAGTYIVKLDITDPVALDTVNFVVPTNFGTGETYQVLDSASTVVFSLNVPAHNFTNGIVAILFGAGHTVRVLQGSTNVTSTLTGFSSSVTPSMAVPGLTAEGQGTNSALDSDFDRTTGLTAPITLSSGENNLDIDGGLLNSVSGETGID
jgi:serine-aspartate repeat-containing protein C/D/E